VALIRISSVPLLLALALFAAGVSLPGFAQESPPPPSAPDPARLPADWWSYFAPAEPIDAEALAARVEQAVAVLDTTAGSLDPLDVERREQLQAQIDAVREALQRYQEDSGTGPVALTPLAPVLEAYTLEEAYTRHRRWLALTAEITFERDEIDWRSDLLAAERRQHSREKVGYLELPETEPERLPSGLELMLSRVQLELNARSLQRRRARLQQLEDQRRQLADELEVIGDRLTAAPDEAEQWNARRAQAEATIARLREPGPAAGSTLASSRSAEVERLAALEALVQQARILASELNAQRTGLAAALVTLVTAEEPLDPQPLTEQIDLADAPMADAERRLQYWRRTLSRLQDVQDGQGGAGADDAARTRAEQRVLAATATGIENLAQATQAVAYEREALAFTLSMLDRRMRLGEDTLTRSWSVTLELIASTFSSARELLSTSLFEVNQAPVTSLGLLRVLLILSVALLVSKGARRALAQLSEKRSTVSQSSYYALGRVIHYFLLAIGIVVALSSIGIDFTRFALLASALGIGIGFGLQQLVSNFVAGLIILFERSLKIGDFVELQSGITGEVREINMRSTLITTNDNVDILVPNSELINNEVTNWTLREAFRRIRVPFGVAYGSDKDTVRRAALEAADAVEWTLKTARRRSPQVWLVGFGDSSLDFELVVWLIPEAVKRPAAVQAAYLWELESKLAAHGVEIPFPQRDLHLRSVFGRREGPLALDTGPPSDAPR
jgi:potassium efflux system protein